MSTTNTPTNQLNAEEVGNLIRHWVHYDSMITALNKQAKNVRDLRNTYEQQILQRLRLANAENVVIQIANGRILVGEDKHSTPLSFRNLETSLHQYYRQKPGQPDETAAIMRFIRSQRHVEVTKCLKRQNTAAPPSLQSVPSVPSLPSLPSLPPLPPLAQGAQGAQGAKQV